MQIMPAMERDCVGLVMAIMHLLEIMPGMQRGTVWVL